MAILAKRDASAHASALIKSAGLDALAGAWLFVSAFLFQAGETSLFINNLTCGAIVAVLSFGGFAHVWWAWLPAAIGSWVVVSPFVLGFSGAAATANNIVTGAVILILAVRSFTVTKSAHDLGMMGE